MSIAIGQGKNVACDHGDQTGDWSWGRNLRRCCELLCCVCVSVNVYL